MTKLKKTIALLLALICFVGAWASAAPAIAAAQSFSLGNNPNVIIEGGRFHDAGFSSAGGGIFKNLLFSGNTITPVDKISDIQNARNLNYVSNKLYFTVYNEATSTTTIKEMSTSGTSATTVVSVSGKIRQMYVVTEGSSRYILFSCAKSIYKFTLGQTATAAAPVAIHTVTATTGFFPTVNGIVCYYKVGTKYTLQAQRSTGATTIATNVLDFTVDGYANGTDTITLYKASSVSTVTLSTVFGKGTIVLTPKVFPAESNLVPDADAEGDIADDIAPVSAVTDSDDTYMSVTEATFDYGEGHDLTSGQTAIIDRARQLQGIKWTCREVFTLNGYTYNDGSVYYGVPYRAGASYVGDKDWGGVSIDDFVSAANNQYSEFYTDRNIPGADCSSFVSYAWDLSARYTTATLPRVSTKIGEFASSEAATTMANLQVGDALIYPWTPDRDGHCMLVASIKYNSDGDLVQIVTIEQRYWTANA